ncbi:MAG TPA: hypothetical protein VFW52_00490 [Candidatus Saccharimonadales bacterium]|nr:hypothetical protein [Candidatus Saccharimonadales bacterium]
MAKKSGVSKGLLWEECIDFGLDGEQSDEYSEPVEGRYLLKPDTQVEFEPDGREDIRPVLITQDDVLRGAVEVIARRKV